MTPEIADQAAKAIKELYLLLPQARRELQAQKAEPTIQATERVYLLERNLQSCCRLLGASKSPRAVDPLLTLVNSSEKLDSPVLAAAAEALGNIGDPAAVEPLTRRLGQCLPLARQYLAARVSPNPVYVPFNEDTAGEIVTALGKLRAVGAVGNMLTLALTNTAGQRLSWAAVCAARASVTLADATNRDRIDRAVLKMLSDPAYDLTVRFVMAKAAGRLRLSAAKAALEKILNQDRPCRQVMHAAAWAIEQITGTAPSIPAPRVRQGLWIIAKPGL